jgi:hypothetical protein
MEIQDAAHIYEAEITKLYVRLEELDHEEVKQKEAKMDLLAKIGAALQGKKAYIVMIAAIFGAIAGYATGDLTPLQAIQAIFAALGLGALRSGVAKSGPTQ